MEGEKNQFIMRLHCPDFLKTHCISSPLPQLAPLGTSCADGFFEEMLNGVQVRGEDQRISVHT
jgi:hypothetical protein